MIKVFIQCFNAGNDINGNPRRVWLAYDNDGIAVDTLDEGYRGMQVMDDIEFCTLPYVKCSVKEYKMLVNKQREVKIFKKGC